MLHFSPERSAGLVMSDWGQTGLWTAAAACLPYHRKQKAGACSRSGIVACALKIVNHQPTVSFGLPPPLSFQGEDRDIVACRSGANLDRENVRVRLPSGLTRRLGDAMRVPKKSKRKKPKSNRVLAYVSQALSIATYNLVNMVLITAVSGAVLLTLLAARHFQDGMLRM